MLPHPLTIATTFMAIIVLLGVPHASAQETAETAQAEAQPDPFVGTYGRGLLDGDTVTITREGDAYRIDKQGYESFTFKQRLKNVLEDDQQTLGTITRGTLSFADAPDHPITVLKVVFCYEHFLLYKKSGANSLATYREALPKTFNFSKNAEGVNEGKHSAAQADHADADVRTPGEAAQPAADPPLIISIDAEGKAHVGNTAMTPAALEQHLRITAPERVIIRADKDTSFKKYLAVMETIKAAGVSDIALVNDR